MRSLFFAAVLVFSAAVGFGGEKRVDRFYDPEYDGGELTPNPYEGVRLWRLDQPKKGKPKETKFMGGKTVVYWVSEHKGERIWHEGFLPPFSVEPEKERLPVPEFLHQPLRRVREINGWRHDIHRDSRVVHGSEESPHRIYRGASMVSRWPDKHRFAVGDVWELKLSAGGGKTQTIRTTVLMVSEKGKIVKEKSEIIND